MTNEEGGNQILQVVMWSLVCIGVLTVIGQVSGLIECLKGILLRGRGTRKFSQKALEKHSGGWGKSWGVVTGGASGIGKEYAREVANAGINVLLIDRDPEGAEKTAKEISDEVNNNHSTTTTTKRAPIEIKVLVADLTDMNICWGKVKESISNAVFGGNKEGETTTSDNNKDLCLLINCAGLTVDPPGKLHEIAPEQVTRIISLNIGALTALTHICVDMMLKQQQQQQTSGSSNRSSRRRGLVINMSSFAARVPLPMLSVYSASKRYVEHLTAALQSEYSGKVDFVCGAPWWVATPMTKIRKANWRVASPSFVARSVLAAGTKSRGTPIDPLPLHALFDVVVQCSPKFLVDKAITWFMLKVRSSYFYHLKKKQQELQQSGATSTTSTSSSSSKKDQ